MGRILAGFSETLATIQILWCERRIPLPHSGDEEMPSPWRRY
jgi:hypothetical protein